jgi:hypothetical protein
MKNLNSILITSGLLLMGSTGFASDSEPSGPTRKNQYDQISRLPFPIGNEPSIDPSPKSESEQPKTNDQKPAVPLVD